MVKGRKGKVIAPGSAARVGFRLERTTSEPLVRKYLTNQQKQEIVCLYEGGMGPSAIGRKMGGIRPEIINTVRTRAGLEPRYPSGAPKGNTNNKGKFKISQEQVLEAKKLRSEGLTYKAIGEMLGFSRMTIWKHLVQEKR